MNMILQRYKFDFIWHFTDKSNLDSIQQNNGLLSWGELQRRGISVPTPGGNQWSHDADKGNGVDNYVHLAFLDDHPMLFCAKQDGRIATPIWLKINSSVLLGDGVRFSSEVSNKAGVQTLTAVEATEQIDFEVLFTRTDWRDPAIQARRRTALKSEILVPWTVPLNMIIDWKNG